MTFPYIERIIVAMTADNGALSRSDEPESQLVARTMEELRDSYSLHDMEKVEFHLSRLTPSEFDKYVGDDSDSEELFGDDAWLVDEVTGSIFDNL